MMIISFSLFPTAINTIIIENVNRHKKKNFFCLHLGGQGYI